MQTPAPTSRAESRKPLSPKGQRLGHRSREWIGILYYTIPYYTILYYTILYYTILIILNSQRSSSRAT